MSPDILLPFFNHVYEGVVTYPWKAKKDKALMRAALQNGMHHNCTRLWLLRLAKQPRWAPLLDVGITNNLKKSVQVPVVPAVAMAEHARWRWLISADGYTASCRFGKMLLTNSLVLKESSPWIEYYYRSVMPGQHYLSFTKDDVMDVLQAARSQPEQAQRMAAAGQRFVHRYLSQASKALYVRKALTEYNRLVPGMAEFVAGLGGGEGDAITLYMVVKAEAQLRAQQAAGGGRES